MSSRENLKGTAAMPPQFEADAGGVDGEGALPSDVAQHQSSQGDRGSGDEGPLPSDMAQRRPSQGDRGGGDDPPSGLLSEYISRSQLCKELRIHPKTMRRLDQAGEGPPRRRIGMRIYYHRPAVAEWLKSGLTTEPSDLDY